MPAAKPKKTVKTAKASKAAKAAKAARQRASKGAKAAKSAKPAKTGKVAGAVKPAKATRTSKPAGKKKPAKKSLVQKVVPRKRVRLPFAELRARKELAERAIDDIRNLMADADPIGAPDDFREREQKALALFSELHTLLPSAEPLSPEERARLEADLADKPDDETLRKILLEMERLVDDPSFPEEFRDQIDRSQIRDALAALDEVALLMPIARATAALAEELSTPRPHDPRAAALRRETEKLAAKRRS